MQFDFETIREILEHRLRRPGIERILHGLDAPGQAQLFYPITELLRRNTALTEPERWGNAQPRNSPRARPERLHRHQ